MRVLATWILALGLAAVPVMAANGRAGDNDSSAAKARADKDATAKSKPADAPADASKADPAKPDASKAAAGKAEPAGMEGELQQLRELLETQAKQLQQQNEQLQEQQKRMESLQEQLNASGASRGTPVSDEASAPPAPSASEASSTAPASQPAAAAPGVTSSSSLNPSHLALSSGTPAVVDPAVRSASAQKEEPKLGPIALQDFKIGATFYGNFTHYTDAGYGPAFQDLPTTQLGPGNSGLNEFEVTRAYINLFYTPNEHVTLRITPDIYRGADSSLVYRLKYAFVDFQKIFGDGAFKNDKLTFGQTQQPLTDWEEGLSGYRYAYLTPWNYLSLSSTYVGAKLHGPIEMNGKEYLDYDIGVFTTASFHAIETNDKKQGMARLTVYPFGTTKDRTGLGLTVFENYGYNTKPPSQVSTPLNRLALLAHYQTHDNAYQIAFEYQLGRNALSTGNMFGGVGPAAGDPFTTAAGTILSGTHTRQQGFDVYGHAALGHSPFSLWGLYQYFDTNTNFHPASANVLDFERTVGGLAYRVTPHFDVAFGDQNFHWRHTQGITGPDTNGIVIWTQFNY
jgi:hypothetical protein